MEVNLPREILEHPHYLRPPSFPHFLWRDLYDPLLHGEHALTRWLFEGFRNLGFTPPVPHVGVLWPDGPEEVKENQRNFARLWLKTQSYAARRWRTRRAHRCELVFEPLQACGAKNIVVSPLAQGGSVLRFSVAVLEGHQEMVKEQLSSALQTLPVCGDVLTGKLPDGNPFVDVNVALYSVLGRAESAEDQEERLFRQVTPLLDAMRCGIQ